MSQAKRSLCGNWHVHKCLRKPAHSGLHQCGTNHWDDAGRNPHAAVDALREELERARTASSYWNKRMAEENVRGNEAVEMLNNVVAAADEMRDAALAVVMEVEATNV
jgi:hypothetical protein